ncbi:hypothetical protein Bbelb_223030 [Branchiostoma belcheri]|nr:hypothetical protein Bbelb_223030 [Branchiostoma belcheri]
MCYLVCVRLFLCVCLYSLGPGYPVHGCQVRGNPNEPWRRGRGLGKEKFSCCQTDPERPSIIAAIACQKLWTYLNINDPKNECMDLEKERLTNYNTLTPGAARNCRGRSQSVSVLRSLFRISVQAENGHSPRVLGTKRTRSDLVHVQ